MPKPSVLDPQGAAVAGAMEQLGWETPARVRVGKIVEIDTADRRPDDEKLRAICRDLLFNPVTEDCSIEFAD